MRDTRRMTGVAAIAGALAWLAGCDDAGKGSAPDAAVEVAAETTSDTAVTEVADTVAPDDSVAPEDSATPDDSVAPEDSATPDETVAPEDSTAPDSEDVVEVDVADTEPPRDFGPPVPEELATALQANLDAHFADAKAPGVAVGVRLPDGSWWEGVAGDACIDPQVSVARDDRFRLGSITKTWVAAAVLQLVDEGKVALDAPVDDYVPGFDMGADVTVRRCLTHTSGIFDLTDDVFSIPADFSAPVDPRKVVTMALAHPRLFAPGQDYSYSNTNYFLLGLLLQEVTGKPIAQVLRERFLDPLDLRDTFLEGAEPDVTTLVHGYAFSIDITSAMDMSWAWAAGAMVSSTGDLCTWAEALWRGDLVAPALLAEMKTPVTLPDGRVTDYGFGTQLATRGGLAVVGHTGETLGFETELFVDPTSGLCVAVLANDIGAAPGALARPTWNVLVPALGLKR